MQLWCFKCSNPVPNHDPSTEQKAIPFGWVHVPLRIIWSSIIISIQSFSYTDIEEKEIIVYKEEDKGPTFKIAIEISRGTRVS